MTLRASLLAVALMSLPMWAIAKDATETLPVVKRHLKKIQEIASAHGVK